MTAQTHIIDEAFLRLLTPSADFLLRATPSAPFVDLRYHEPEIPRRECDISAARRVDIFGGELSPEMKTSYRKVNSELRRFEPAQILFTSLEPGQGTSFTAGNLAAQWAEDFSAEKILYVEFFIGGDEDERFTDKRGEIFTDARQLEKYIGFAPTQKLFHLRVFAAHADSRENAEWWDRLTATFDRIFFDCSPLNYNPLTAWLAARCRGAALIARQPPNGEVVEKIGEEMTRAGGRLLGVILNASGK